MHAAAKLDGQVTSAIRRVVAVLLPSIPPLDVSRTSMVQTVTFSVSHYQTAAGNICVFIPPGVLVLEYVLAWL